MVEPGVTVVVRRRVLPGLEKEFEEWLRGVIAAASGFEGHLGANVIRPRTSGEDWVLVFRFDSEAHLEAWERSPIRVDWLARAEGLTSGSPSMQKASGLEYWFTLPGHAATIPPPRWKMAIVTVIGIFPLILWAVPLLAEALAKLPSALATLVVTSIIVVVMTWVVMPALVRLFRPWLFPIPSDG